MGSAAASAFLLAGFFAGLCAAVRERTEEISRIGLEFGERGRFPSGASGGKMEAMFAYRDRRRFSPEEYLNLEERSDTKSEFYGGEIYVMAGASIEHNQIVRNLSTELDNALRGGECQVFVADMRLYVARHQLFTYPDLLVVCGSLPRMPGRRDTLDDARLIIEVLSPGTEVYDRGEKFLFYQSLPSFEEYLVVGQDRPFAERHVRQSPSQWLSTTYGSRSETLELASLQLTIPLDSIYRGVEL